MSDIPNNPDPLSFPGMDGKEVTGDYERAIALGTFRHQFKMLVEAAKLAGFTFQHGEFHDPRAMTSHQVDGQLIAARDCILDAAQETIDLADELGYNVAIVRHVFTNGGTRHRIQIWDKREEDGGYPEGARLVDVATQPGAGVWRPSSDELALFRQASTNRTAFEEAATQDGESAGRGDQLDAGNQSVPGQPDAAGGGADSTGQKG